MMPSPFRLPLPRDALALSKDDWSGHRPQRAAKKDATTPVLPDSDSDSDSETYSGDESVEQLTRLSERLLTISHYNRTSSSSSSDSPWLVQSTSQGITRDKENRQGLLSSSLQSGLSQEVTSGYICARPEKPSTSASTSSTELAQQTRQLVLTDHDRQRLTELAAGARPAEVKPRVGKKAARKQRQAERDKTKGAGWFDMKAPEMTEERKRDLEVLQMRSALDPKRFYKKNDLATLPKYFQIGKVVDSPSDYYSDRIANKDRKNTLVDELMADAEFKKYNKRKYAEIIEEKSKFQRRKTSGGKKRKA